MRVRRARPAGGQARSWPTSVGNVALPGCIMPASGTYGFGDEIAGYVDPRTLGAIVTKSLAAFEHGGNPAPRVAPTPAGMVNSVGLQGPGIAYWAERYLPSVQRLGVPLVVSIWGRSAADYGEAASLLAPHAESIAAIEINLSCPNLAGKPMFAHDPEAAAEAVHAVAAAGIPCWAELSANTDRTVAVAEAVRDAGASAVTLINTLMGVVIDVETAKPVLGAVRGGLSGVGIHPVAVKTVWEVAQALPGLPIVGVGGVCRGVDAVELMMAGACAVQVGTANFADPSALGRIIDEFGDYCDEHEIDDVASLVGKAHR